MKKAIWLMLIVFVCFSLFSGCSSKEAESEVIDPSVVFECGDWQYTVKEDGTAVIVKYNGSDNEIIIPYKLDGRFVEGIGNYAFSGKFMNIVTIPNSVTSVGSNPFCECKLLKEIRVSPDHPSLATIDGVLFSKPDKRLICYPWCFESGPYSIPEGIQIIGDYAFYGCSFLSSISIPNSVISIGGHAFESCSSIKEIKIPDGVTEIENDVFNGCSSLSSIRIPESVTKIGDGAFCGCSGLYSITIPNSVAFIGTNPFVNCEKLKKIVVSQDHPYLFMVDGSLVSKPDNRLICYLYANTSDDYLVPEGIYEIGDSAFSCCKSLVKVEIAPSVKYIGSYAFSYCSSLQIVIIPDSVINIQAGAFSCCSSLGTIALPNGMTMISDNMFSQCSSLIGVMIPESITSIGDGVFYRCEDLSLIIIPESVKYIGNYAFSYCSSLKELTIPDSVLEIGSNAFANCSGLIVKVSRDSFAKQYCEQNGVKYIYLDANDWLNE